MRRLRAVSIILFIISVVLFGANYYRNRFLKDQTGPVFQMDSELVEVSVKDGQDAWTKGMTATDVGDGDVTDSIIVESIGPFNGMGHRVVNCVAFDSDNHVTHSRRELSYTDYRAPRFHLNKPLSFAMNTTNLLNGITVEDSIDGDLTKSVRMISDQEIDTDHVGEYSARLKASNSAGGVSYLPVTIEIFDASIYYKLPQIKLTDYVVYVEKGTDFDEGELIKTITINGTEYTITEERGTYGATTDSTGAAYRTSSGVTDETNNTIGYDLIEIDSEVDTDVSGYYEVVYSFEDTEFMTGTGKVRLYVVVTNEGSSER